MIKVTLVGTGTVSKHLSKVFAKTKNVRVIQVLSSRQDFPLEVLSEETDIYIIAVSDDAISSVSQKLRQSNKMLVHTSGSVSIEALPKEVRKGIFYPLQTFSKGREVDFNTIPICVEAERKEDFKILKELANSISKTVYEISSEQRKSIHVSAVFVNNFANHMYQIANELCALNEIPFDILKPLITETTAKLENLSPMEAQTGPAKRDDLKTIERHLNQIKNETHKEIYQILTKSIKETYGKKL